MTHPSPQSRRDFIRRMTIAGTAGAAAAALGLWRRDFAGPSGRSAVRAATFDSYAMSGATAQLSVVRGAERAKTVRKAVELIGGIDRFVKRGDRVLIKVNAAFALPAALGATTHPDALAALIRMCRDAGAASVVVTDNPINDPASCFRLTGLEQACTENGAKLVLPAASLFKPVSIPDGKLIRDWPALIGAFSGVTKVIGLSPVKDHHRSGASLSMKNWYGLVGGRRNIFHQNIHTFIPELARMMRPTFVVLDGTTTMMTNGPTGGSLSDLKATNTVIASTDQVAADACALTLLERKIADVPFIANAAKAGAGTLDFESLKPARAEA